jgi:hypothetical protein
MPNPDGSPSWTVVNRSNGSITVRFDDPCEVKLNHGLVTIAGYNAQRGSQYTVHQGQGISFKFRGQWIPLSL